MPVERRGNLALDCWDFAQGKACRVRSGGGLLATIGVVNATYLRVMSMGLGEALPRTPSLARPLSVSLKNWHSPCPSLARQVWTSSEAIAEERASPLSWGLLPRPARDCPENQFRAIGVPREAT